MRLSDRDAVALLHEVGIGPGSAAALVWRLKAVDGFDNERIAQEAGIKPECVPVYLSRVNRRLRQGHEQYVVSEAEADLPDEEEDPHEALTEEARALLHAIENKPAPPDHGGEAVRSPVVSVHDARQIIARLPVEFLPVVGEPGENGKRRKSVTLTKD